MIKKLIEKVYGKFCQCNDEIKTEETMIKKMMRADFENVGQSIHVF